MVGVRNQYGKVIISPVQYFLNIDEKYVINDETIEMDYIKSPISAVENSPAMPYGAVYNRKGEFLYSPQWYDNGMDYWEEGLRRYVEDNKIGFVDRYGEKVLPAKWDFVTPFHYGYAAAIEGDLSKRYEKGGEHWGIAGDTVRYLINQKGQRVNGYSVKKHPKDYPYKGLYYPYPFEYSTAEQALLNSLEKDSVGISFLFGANHYKYSYQALQLEITERPSVYRPFYVIEMYNGQEQSRLSFAEFYIDVNSREKYIEHYKKGRISLQDAIINCLEEFVNSKKEDILPNTREIASQELKRLKSQP